MSLVFPHQCNKAKFAGLILRGSCLGDAEGVINMVPALLCPCSVFAADPLLD